MFFLYVTLCFAELIKEVRTNGPNLNKLLKTPINELERNCVNEALMAAVETGNQSNVGKLILRGASCIDEALDKSRKLKTYSVTATLLIIKAAMVDDQILILTLYGEDVDGLDSKILITVRDNLSELQNCVLDQSFKTAVAIEISRRNNAPKVREELLLRTGIDKEEGTVLWFGLRLTQLEISWLQKVCWVKELMLACNEFPSLPKEMGTYLKHCTKIDLQQNRLRKVPYSLLELPCIATLNLSHNYIVEIPDVPQLPASLFVLKLSHNHLRSLPNFGAPKLEILDISFNQLHTVPDCVCSFLALTTLNIAYNSTILTLPNQLGQLKNLHDLNLEGLNDLNHPPKNYRASTDDCIQYLNSQLRNAHEYLHMKLMVLGKPGVGKSTIVARLLSKQISNESCSIVISKWKHTPQSSGKRTFNFRIWDFTNQEGYDATYHCFLSKRSMYLLLWNVTEGDDGVSSLKPFLDSISTQVPDSCVIIVGTFLDMLSDEEKSEKVNYLLGKVQELTAQYHSLFVASHNVVGLQYETEDLVKLKDDIYNAASEYKLNNRCVMGAMIPSSYHTLDRKLISIYQKLKKNRCFMYAGEFRKLIRDYGLTDIKDDDYEEIHNASQFLHEVGALLFYADSKHNLDDLYIIDPSFLYDILSAVVSVKQMKSYAIQGILKVEDLFCIVKDMGFPVKYFLTLLNKFEIALPLDNECRRILIPSLLPITRSVILSDEKRYFKRFILFSPLLSESQYFWSQLLSSVTKSVKEVMDVINEQIPVNRDDIISTSDYFSSETRSFCSISDELLEHSSSVWSESVSPITDDSSYLREESIESYWFELCTGKQDLNTVQIGCVLSFHL
ncbi:leucine-rich repeat serine/threonine-protein kinase 1-like [Dysidea avara]|uniref:leucine-rich repeat serine/threonine-protein kinase 1-like n=1 Tax=Dysidea avara TaxID=196820 RepID=UPI003322FB07